MLGAVVEVVVVTFSKEAGAECKAVKRNGSGLRTLSDDVSGLNWKLR